MNVEQRLKKIGTDLDNGIAPSSVTVRELLSWFDCQRRGVWVVDMIRTILKEDRLRTVPDFEGEYLDHKIAFERITGQKNNSQSSNVRDDGPPDPTYRIGKLASANSKPMTVKPDDSIERAITLMLANDFSQLPVMTTEREIKGAISWETIGSRIALGMSCDKVRHCMESFVEIDPDTSLFDAIDRIIDSQYVLIRAGDGTISGIVTTSDLSLQFKQLGEPFLLIGEIENYLRRMLQSKFSAYELDSAKDSSDSARKIERVADLTFGEYRRLFENPDHWMKVDVAIDRKEFVAKLDQVRRIRNDVMHFDPDGIPCTDMTTLREFAGFLQRLAVMGAI